MRHFVKVSGLFLLAAVVCLLIVPVASAAGT